MHVQKLLSGQSGHDILVKTGKIVGRVRSPCPEIIGCGHAFFRKAAGTSQLGYLSSPLYDGSDLIEQPLCIEHVHTRVDGPAHQCFWLFGVMQQLFGGWIQCQLPAQGSTFRRHGFPHDGSQGTVVALVCFEQVLQREGAAHVAMDDEEVFWFLFKDDIPVLVQATCRSCFGGFFEVLHPDVEFGRHRGEVKRELLLFEESKHEYLLQSRNFRTRRQRMMQHGFPCDGKQRLGHLEGEWSEPRSFRRSSHEDHRHRRHRGGSRHHFHLHVVDPHLSFPCTGRGLTRGRVTTQR
mmetsp:Transcript_6309/g.39308  ORF Transcript_6309/g.39308 Transcript_6309/m.39308 type:complete len:293 (-) Transcript_6309:80-958(-)